MSGRSHPLEPGPRISTAIRFPAATHEALKETADALDLGVNWLVVKLVEEGLANMDLEKLRGNFLSRRPQ